MIVDAETFCEKAGRKPPNAQRAGGIASSLAFFLGSSKCQ
jgi:hypothetical protein